MRTIFFLLLVSSLTACSDEQNSHKLNGKTMGTTWSIHYLHHSPIVKQQTVDSELDRFNQIMSTYEADSELSRLNRQTINQWIPISPELEDVIQIATKVSILTDGAFDITVGRAVDYWGFGASDVHSSNDPNTVGYQYLQLADHKILKEKNFFIDLSAIAKGYAVDQIAVLLDSLLLEHYLIEIGGEIKVKGNNDGKKWQVAIESPSPYQRTVLMVMALNNNSVASSGTYRNFRKINGSIISHTIDPKTAKPINHTTIASSVVHSSAAVADAMATAFMVLSVKKSLKISNESKISTLLITGDITQPNSWQLHPSLYFQKYL